MEKNWNTQNAIQAEAQAGGAATVGAGVEGLMSLIKWTDYYGRIQRVRVELNADGLVTGHMSCDTNVGVWHMTPIRLGDDYFDTRDDAIEHFKKRKFSSLWWKKHPNYNHGRELRELQTKLRLARESRI